MSGKRSLRPELRMGEEKSEGDFPDEFIEMALWFTKEVQREHMGIPRDRA